MDKGDRAGRCGRWCSRRATSRACSSDRGVGRRFDGHRPRGAAHPVPGARARAGRAVAREFFDMRRTPGESARCCSHACSRRRRARRSRTCGPSMGPSLAGDPGAQDRGPADVHAADALLTCMEVELGLERGPRRHLPDPRDRRGDPAGVRDRDRVAARRVHGRRGLALRRHPPGARLPVDGGGGGDALPAVEGAGRRARPRGSATRSAACGAAASTISTGCAPWRPSSATSGTTG